ncbi:unnamed protein product [Caenorhabditis angaria]|uniref:Tyrosine-protein kinase catalytic domain-containing protein n=1 Tax=Caenorhabditis angaria TaxID=860376 RepID=A0A9P1I8M0_9PELO|nr:unnamed protein product [Caenorhabditis angaria]
MANNNQQFEFYAHNDLDHILRISDFRESERPAETISTLIFTPKTDVYSYGVLCFEIFSEGEEPWHDVTNAEVKKNVVSGRYLHLPDSCPDKLRRFINEKIYVVDSTKRAGIKEVLRMVDFEIAILEEKEKEKEGEKDLSPLSTSCGHQKNQHQHLIPNPHHKKNKKKKECEF